MKTNEQEKPVIKAGQMQFDFSTVQDDTLLNSEKPLSETAKKLLKILPLHKGKANAIFARDLVSIVGVDSRTVTAGASELKEHQYPLCSTRDDGYWWSNDAVEFNEYLNKQEKENADRIRRTRRQRESPLGQALITH